MTSKASSSTFTYPKPTSIPSRPNPTVPPPPLLPYLDPPFKRSIPPLPKRKSVSAPEGWNRIEHIIPAAYPRRFQDCFGTYSRESKPFEVESPKEGETKEERMARNEGEARETVRRRFDALEWKSPGEGEDGLLIAAERWVRLKEPKSADEGVTLVLTHANGFTKESWHPALRRLLNLDQSKRINEIWLLDDIHHAASIDVNKGRLGSVHDWSSGGRDIINFLEHVWQGGNTGNLSQGQILRWRASDEMTARKRRKVIGVGHSFGGNALVQAAADRPDLFESLFLVEPMCTRWSPPRSTIQNLSDMQKWFLVLGATKRRTKWSSIAEAGKLRQTPFFGAWHPEVWDLFVSHGLVPVEEGGEAVQLATPSWAEACVFGEPTGIAEGWDKLGKLQIPVGFLLGEKSRSMYGYAQEMVWRPPKASNEVVKDGDHLLVQEDPDVVADALNRFLDGKFGNGSDRSERDGSIESRSKL